MLFSTTTGVLPVTCEVGLSRSVRAFHIMPGLPGPEGQLHDHDYRIEVVVDREQLDDRGMVCDLDVLEAALTELCTHVFPFDQAADAFRAVDESPPGLMHAVLDYNRSHQ